MSTSMSTNDSDFEHWLSNFDSKKCTQIQCVQQILHHANQSGIQKIVVSGENVDRWHLFAFGNQQTNSYEIVRPFVHTDEHKHTSMFQQQSTSSDLVELTFTRKRKRTAKTIAEILQNFCSSQQQQVLVLDTNCQSQLSGIDAKEIELIIQIGHVDNNVQLPGRAMRFGRIKKSPIEIIIY